MAGGVGIIAVAGSRVLAGGAAGHGHQSVGQIGLVALPAPLGPSQVELGPGERIEAGPDGGQRLGGQAGFDPAGAVVVDPSRQYRPLWSLRCLAASSPALRALAIV